MIIVRFIRTVPISDEQIEGRLKSVGLTPDEFTNKMKKDIAIELAYGEITKHRKNLSLSPLDYKLIGVEIIEAKGC